MLIFSKKNSKISKAFYDHNEDVANSFEALTKFFMILFSEDCDNNKLQSAKVAVDNYEHAADQDLRRCIDMMSESFLPVTRSNLIAIAQATDEVANVCQDIARQIVLEHIQVPEFLQHDIMEILSITKGQLEITYIAIDKLLNDFKDISRDRKILDSIRDEESKVDNIETMLHERIFDADMPLYEKVYYRDLIDDICQISDEIEDIADLIQVMLVEREA